MRKLLLIAAMFCPLVLGGGTCLSNITEASLTTTQVYVAAQAFDAAEVTATNYLSLPACVAHDVALCPAAGVLVSATRGGYKARRALVATCAASITAAACISDYAAVTAAVNGLQSAFVTYSISKGS